MHKPYYHTTLFAFFHSEVRYIPSANTVNDQGVGYTIPTSMANTYSYLISYFMLKTHMKKLSDTVLWVDHIKAPLNMLILNLHGLQIWPHLPDVHQQLLLLINLNPHILFHIIRIPYALKLLSLSLHKFNMYLHIQPRIQPLNLVMKLSTRTLYDPFPSVLSI